MPVAGTDTVLDYDQMPAQVAEHWKVDGAFYGSAQVISDASGGHATVNIFSAPTGAAAAKAVARRAFLVTHMGVTFAYATPSSQTYMIQLRGPQQPLASGGTQIPHVVLLSASSSFEASPTWARLDYEIPGNKLRAVGWLFQDRATDNRWQIRLTCANVDAQTHIMYVAGLYIDLTSGKRLPDLAKFFP